MKYALLGYTYQHYVACLILAMMDVERQIDWVGLEADVDHKFDDIIVKKASRTYAMQLKDIDGVSLEDISFSPGHILIRRKPHRLSEYTNILFFKDIEMKANTTILGFPALRSSGVYLVALSREETESKIAQLYANDPHRRQLMQHFLAVRLDDRKMELDRSQLPALAIFDTGLAERTIKVARRILEFQDILYIEGKPGVGKSHLVSLLEERFSPSILYRFWISNQDKDYEERLKFTSFKNDLSKKLFFDQRERSEDEIMEKLNSSGNILIVDGFDHVENYRNVDLASFVNFFDRAKKNCKVIVLGRPLAHRIVWKKQVLGNWNRSQTMKVLKELYHIDDYPVREKIYQLTSGYPILVRYIAEQYKNDGVIPVFGTLPTINAYYDQLFSEQQGKSMLSVFLCCRGYLMDAEIDIFLGEMAGPLVREFIAERPYLFERKLNRLSLYHDSLNTYLRHNATNIPDLRLKVNSIVFSSLIVGEARFQSRVAHFDFQRVQIVALIKYYSSIKKFSSAMQSVIDFEAVQEFYGHLRDMLCHMASTDFEIVEYYEMALIFNTVTRDHFSTQSGFYFTYAKLLGKHGYNEEFVTSSGYLFGMLLYLRDQDATHLFNLKSDGHYDTSRFYKELEHELDKEEGFFEIQSRPFNKKSIDRVLRNSTDFNFIDNLTLILVNVYLYPVHQKRYPLLFSAIDEYFRGKQQLGARNLGIALSEKSWSHSQCLWVLGGASSKLLELGVDPDNNDYLKLSLKDYLKKYGQKGSFDLSSEVLSHIRLALEKEKTIDVESISAFFTKYYQRKDYTLFAVDQALTVFEEQGLIDWRDSVELIQYLQQISEKGYRWLLGSYLELHKPCFILELLAEFSIKSINVSWFKLESQYLEVIPQDVYEYELSEQLRYHGYSKDIPIDELRNLFPTKWLPSLKSDLRALGYVISLGSDDKHLQFLKDHGIRYLINSVDSRYKDKDSAMDRYGKGILDKKNAFLIRELSLTPGQVALAADGNYTALADASIYRCFEGDQLRSEMKTIFFNALTSKSGYSDSLNVTWVMPGTILKLLHEAEMPINYRLFLDSFKEYLSLAMLELGVTNP